MKNYLIAFIALIGLVLASQGVSADPATLDYTYDGTCPSDITATVSIDSEGTLPSPPANIYPNIPACLGVKKCGVTVDPNCTCSDCGCSLNANGLPAPYGEGTHCAAPGGYLKCPYVPTSCTTAGNACDYDANGMWVGNNAGGYEYDEDDGYKMGIKEVNVSVTVNSPTAGIQILCGTGGPDPAQKGSIVISADTYDSQNGMMPRYAITLIDPVECLENPTATSATWKGKLKMHYWEKPGLYTVNVQMTTCCKDSYNLPVTRFNYVETAALCMAPPGKNIYYGKGSCYNKNITTLGDVITSNCTQCDIGSAPATIRNIGNAVINTKVSGTDLKCTDYNKCGNDQIQVGRDSFNTGNIWIDLGNGWRTLWLASTDENLAAQSYCTKEVQVGCCNKTNVTINGLPPGPHATNIMNLMVAPVPCLRNGTYSQTITIVQAAIEGCCQDHREIAYPVDNRCITSPLVLPQCYETVTGLRYPVGKACT